MIKLRLFLVTIFTIFVTLSYGQIKFKAATSVGGASLDRGTTFDYVIYANGNSNLTITDVYQIYYKLAGGIANWQFSVPTYRLFTTSQWSTINTSSVNLTSTISGTQSITLDSLISNDTTNLYLIRTGYRQ